jgi:hypothetical protein
MLHVVTTSGDRGFPGKSRRRGSISPLLAVGLPMFVAALALAVELALIRDKQTQLLVDADAAALAGAQTLVPLDDTVLFGVQPIPNSTRDAILGSPGTAGNPVGANPEGVRPRAIRLAMLNGFEGADPLVNPNVTPDPPCTTTFNDPNGQIVIGTKNSRTDTTFNTNLTLPWDLYVPRYNTVKVSLSRAGLEITRPTTVTVQATAFLDRDVIGFHVQSPASLVPPGTVPAIPVMPFAIRSNSGTPPLDPGSWDQKIINRNFPFPPLDNFKFDALGNPVPGSDGVPEIVVLFDLFPFFSNGRIVQVGTATVTPGVVGQVTTGITATQLNTFDPSGRATLTLNTGADNKVDITELPPAVGDFANLAAAFNSILGRRRVWMLYDQTRDPLTPPALGKIRVVGFVAARIMDVVTDNTTFVAVVLQPTLMVTANALTDTPRRNLGPRRLFDPNTGTSTPSIFNPYIGRIDIVQYSPLP